MNFEQKRERLCEIGRRIWQRGLSPGTGGNISIRLAKNKILISPTLASVGFLDRDDLCLIDREGNVIEGNTKPSMEYKMHLHVYMARPDINAVIHAHPPCATAFSVTGERLNTFIQPETVVFLGEIPLVEYGTPSTDQLPMKLDKYLRTNANTFLLQNHGVLCIGSDLLRTYYNLETLENLARVVILSRLLGGEKEIRKNKLKELVNIFGLDLKI